MFCGRWVVTPLENSRHLGQVVLSGLGDGIAALGMKHNYFFTSEEVYAHADFLGQGGDLTDFELEMISGGGRRGGGR